MKKLRYIFLLLIAVLSGFAISSCEDDDVVAAEVTEEAAEGSGETVKTTFTISLSAPDVSADLDPVTRAGDNANIEYAKPENGGRFQNIVVVLTDADGYIKGVHCHNWADNVGVKEYNVIFSDIQVPATDVTNKKTYKVYAFGNICEEHYKDLSGEASAKVGHKLDNSRVYNTESNGWPNMFSYCIEPTLSVGAEDIYKISFVPGEYKYKVSSVLVKSTGMPVNNSATATVVKGNTQFNVALKRVCARLQVTFRNFTGKTDYDHYYDSEATGNRVYVDNFVLKKALTTSTKYFYNGSAPTTVGSVDFNILEALGGTNNHKINKIENGEDLVVSMYVFETIGNLSKTENRVTTKYYTYDLKVDRGKSLGNQAFQLQDDNVYVMWDDHSDDDRTYKNKYGYCLGVNGSSISLKQMEKAEKIPFRDSDDDSDYGNNVFWHYTGKKFESCNVNLGTDVCKYLTKYIPTAPSGIGNKDYSYNLTSSGQTFTPDTKSFDGGVTNRTRLQINSSNCLQISQDKLQKRYFMFGIGGDEGYYPWVFFAKYIIKNGETFSTGTGTSKTAISQIERNHSYELDFSVMPNYDTKQEILVNCVRKQNEINWSEVEK